MRTLATWTVGALLLFPALATAQFQPPPDQPRNPMGPYDQSFWELEVGLAPAFLGFGGTGTGQNDLAGDLHVEFTARLTPSFGLVLAPDAAIALAPRAGWAFLHVALGARLANVLPVTVTLGGGAASYIVGGVDNENGGAFFLHLSRKLSPGWGIQGGIAVASFAAAQGEASRRTVFLASVGVYARVF
jgi:hypothetical protein